MDVCLDVTTLIALGAIGELDLLSRFDGQVVIAETVAAEVNTEPARTNLQRFCTEAEVDRRSLDATFDDPIAESKRVLDEEDLNGDVVIVAAVLADTAQSVPIGVVSDDRRVRTVARGLGATVTGTIGVVRAVEEGMALEDVKRLLERIDEQGLHMTAELRETVYRLVEHAVDDRQ
jgi:predicted nucleic acid-binding protein